MNPQPAGLGAILPLMAKKIVSDPHSHSIVAGGFDDTS